MSCANARKLTRRDVFDADRIGNHRFCLHTKSSETSPVSSHKNQNTMNEKNKRLGFVGIIINDREKSSGPVNAILSEHAALILARTGLPRARGSISVITLTIDATTDEVGRLTGKLGTIPGVSVKSALSGN